MRVSTSQLGAMQEYVKTNCEEWYQFGRQNCGLSLGDHDLVLVTAAYKNASWALAAASSNLGSSQMTFAGSASIATGARLKIVGKWSSLLLGGMKEGPQTSEAPHPLVRSSDIARLSSTAVNLDQCLFLRGFKVSCRQTSLLEKLKRMFIPEELRAAAQPQDLPPPPPPDAAAAPVQAQDSVPRSITPITSQPPVSHAQFGRSRHMMS